MVQMMSWADPRQQWGIQAQQMQNPMYQLMQMQMEQMQRQYAAQQQARQYAAFNNSLPAELRLTSQTGQAQADQARSDYLQKTLNPMIAEARTSDLNMGQNSTFAGGRISALETAGAAEASRLAEQARQDAIGNVTQARSSYLGVPVNSSSPTSAAQQSSSPGSSWLDRLPAYAQLAYGGANALRYASPYIAQGIGGLGNVLGGIGRGIGQFGSGFMQGGASANPVAGGGYYGDGQGPTYRYGQGF